MYSEADTPRLNCSRVVLHALGVSHFDGLYHLGGRMTSNDELHIIE